MDPKTLVYNEKHPRENFGSTHEVKNSDLEFGDGYLVGLNGTNKALVVRFAHESHRDLMTLTLFSGEIDAGFTFHFTI